MLVELIGPGGAGKTTVEPLIASRLGITYYPGKRRHGVEGETLAGWQVLIGWIVSVLHSPMLFARAVKVLDRPLRSRLRFALDICRRHRFATRAARLGSGVLASGPLHGLCEASARYRCDTTSLASYVKHADIYIHLIVDVEEAKRRLRERRVITGERYVAHWQNYEEAASKAFSRLDQLILEVDANPAPQMVAAEVASRLQALMEEVPP